MIAVVANVIVRLLTRDDETQYQASLKLFSRQDIFIPDTVVLETDWVLRYAYDFEPAAISTALRKLFGLPNVTLKSSRNMAQIIAWYESGLDFADAFHWSQSEQIPKFKTFDEKFIKRAKTLQAGKCKVEKV